MEQTENTMPEVQSASESYEKKSMPWVKIGVVVLVLAAIFLAALGLKGSGPLAAAAQPDPNLHQAVFLTNGQVYFGKIDHLSRQNIVLSDIYYLQVVQPLQQREPGQQPVGQQQSQEPALNLVKMGSEIHGPTDKMVIPMTSVVFWEDIKADGIVSGAIQQFKNRQNQ